MGPLSSIGEDVTIGAETALWAGMHDHGLVRIGARVTIHSGTVIGSDGFGFERTESGERERCAHIAGAVIKDDVEIGANADIDRGTLGNTRVCAGAKIANLAHIRHNVPVGARALVIANVTICGGTQIGEETWIAPSACLRDGIRIGDRASVGLGSVVTKDVEDGSVVFGVPARPADKGKLHLTCLDELVTQRSRD